MTPAQDATALADQLQLLINEYDPVNSDWAFRRTVIHEVIRKLRASPRTPDAGLRDALTQIDTLAVCTGVVDPALHERMLSNIARIARAALRATSQTPDAVQKILDHEEDYLTDHLTAECGLMSGDIEGSFQRIKDVLSTPSASAGPQAEAVSPTLGSSIDLLIGIAFQNVETLDPNAKHKYYKECGCCGGTDQNRDHYKPDLNKVEHKADCPLARDLPILRAIGLASDASHAHPQPQQADDKC